MVLLLVSFIAGVLTVLAPCVLPLLPIIIGGAAQGQNRRNPYVITGSLAVAIVLFTLLLKFSTALINVPPQVWSYISGTVLILFGLTSLFPAIWEQINFKLGLSSRSDTLLTESAKKQSIWGDMLIGLSLGPVFSSCSPTYFIILATVLPQSFAAGLLDLIAYALGLSLVLLLISVLGQRFIKNAKWAADPRGWFKRGLGILFILVGVFIITGADKRVQTYFVEKQIFSSANIEQLILKKVNNMQPNTDDISARPTGGFPSLIPSPADTVFPRYREIASPGGYVNSEPFTIGQFVGKKIILVDFMTYSCINCIRTFPYLNAWYGKYKDQGLEIVGIHTPEFAFEHKLENVQKALDGYGIKFPVVLDNDYGTWNAYSNSYWPRKYLIDIDGRVVYDHIGEGKYDETEQKIQELLKQKAVRDKQAVNLVPGGIVTPEGTDDSIKSRSPETYFGSDRNRNLGNGNTGVEGEQKFIVPGTIDLNELYLGGTWNLSREYAETKSNEASIVFRYAAQDVYLVASSAKETKIIVTRDGAPLPAASAGSDVEFENGVSFIMIKADRIYNIVTETGAISEHLLKFEIKSPGLKAYTFTFG